MKKRRFEYGKYTADVFINNRKVTILMNRDGRADSSILDIPLILLKDISHFILESHLAEIEKLIKNGRIIVQTVQIMVIAENRLFGIAPMNLRPPFAGEVKKG